MSCVTNKGESLLLPRRGAPAEEASGLSLISIGRDLLVDEIGTCSLVAGLLCPIEELDKTLRTLPRFAGIRTGVA